MVKEEMPKKAPRVGDWRAVMDLRYWTATDFHMDYTQLVVDMSVAHGQGRVARSLDFAELLASHMMLPEAASTIAGIRPELDKDVERHEALRLAIALLQGKPVEGLENSALMDEERPDRELWSTLGAVAQGDARTLLRDLPKGFNGLAYQSAAVVRAVLPAFTEAAIQAQQSELASVALRIMDEIPELRDASVGHYLRGAAAEAIGNNKTALLAYLDAANGLDGYAARGRLALAAMAKKDGGRGALLAARDTISSKVNAWRGPPYELPILTNLAELNEGIGDGYKALLVHAQIMIRFGGTEEAAHSRKMADVLMKDIYARGARGEVSLAEWVKVHLQLMPFMRAEPEFVLHTEVLADRAYELGGTDLARKEYQRGLELMAVGRASPRYVLPEHMENRLRIKLAKSLYTGGQYEMTLKQIGMLGEPMQEWVKLDAADLRAKALFKLERNTDFLMQASHVDTATRLRQRAKASARQEKWEQSKTLLSEMLAAHSDDFEMRDAVNLLIAAKRTDDEETVNRVTFLFPELTESEALFDLAKRIAKEPGMIKALGEDQVMSRLQRYKGTLEGVEGIDSKN